MNTGQKTKERLVNMHATMLNKVVACHLSGEFFVDIASRMKNMDDSGVPIRMLHSIAVSASVNLSISNVQKMYI